MAHGERHKHTNHPIRIQQLRDPKRPELGYIEFDLFTEHGRDFMHLRIKPVDQDITLEDAMSAAGHFRNNNPGFSVDLEYKSVKHPVPADGNERRVPRSPVSSLGK